MEELIGKTIESLSVSKDQSILAFYTDAGVIAYEVEGDCCSESWFADINGVSALINGKVTASDIVSMDGYNVEDGRCRQEYDAAYGIKITTDKGYADIVFRNSSNGYYGGWMNKFSASLPDVMVQITNDWQA